MGNEDEMVRRVCSFVFREMLRYVKRTHMARAAKEGKLLKENEDLPTGLDALTFVEPHLMEKLDFLAALHVYCLEGSPALWPDLIEDSREDWLAWRTLQYLVVMLPSLEAWSRMAPVEEREQWQNGVEALKQWACEAVSTIRPEPSRPHGRHAKENLLRDIAIWVVVQEIHDCSDLPYTDDYDELRSACGLVAERLGMKYATVRTIWRTRFGRARRKKNK